MIKLKEEALLPIREAALTLPGKPHLSTIYRWVREGCNGVYLETLMVGARRFTSHEALQRFVEKLTQHAVVKHGREPELTDEDLLRSSYTHKYL